MHGLPDETLVQILAALSGIEISTAVVRVSQTWHELRSSTIFRAARAAVDERGLVVAGGWNVEGDPVRICRVLAGGRWWKRAPLPHDLLGSSTTFRGELVLLGREYDGAPWSKCCRAFNLEANAWRSLAWEADQCVYACCATDTVVVALSRANDRIRLRSLRPGGVEGWVPIPDPPVEVMSVSECPPSLCCVGEVLYLVGGQDQPTYGDALQSYDLSTRAWTVRSPLPVSRCESKCVLLAGRLYVVGGYGERLASVFSYDPRTDRWRSESPLPFENYDIFYGDSDFSTISAMSAVAHEGRLVVLGIKSAPPLALVDDVWIELPPLPARRNNVQVAHAASLRFE